MNNYYFKEWNKLDLENFLLSDKIIIEEKINILGDLLNWRKECLLDNIIIDNDMYPIFNLFLTYVYIKEKLTINNISDYLTYQIDFKNKIESMSNKDILAGMLIISIINKFTFINV